MVCIAAGGLKGTAPWGTLRSKRLSPSNHELLGLNLLVLFSALSGSTSGSEEVVAAGGAENVQIVHLQTQEHLFRAMGGLLAKKRSNHPDICHTQPKPAS